MSKDLQTIVDVRGARGSNAGDQFHELWALEQILALLDVRTNLRAVTVEGIVAPQWQATPEGPTWDGVDCGLFFGGASLATAQHVEFAQLKYSSDPDKSWSIARLTASTAMKKKNLRPAQTRRRFYGSPTENAVGCHSPLALRQQPTSR